MLTKGLALKSELTAERLRALLHYDPATGVFTRRRNIKGGARAGDIAGASHGDTGYRKIGVDGRLYFEHRLAWFYVHGRWPALFIDHINEDRSDNRLCNLREADHSQNQQTMKPRRDCVSGVRGVYWHRQRQQWHAEIKTGGKRRSLGLHETLEQASAARVAAQQSLHPYARRDGS